MSYYNPYILFAKSAIVAPPSTLLTNITAYYKLDELSGNAIDEVAGNNGVSTNITYAVSGKIGNAYSFAGNSKVTLPSTSAITFGSGDWSINLWCYLTSNVGSSLISGAQNAMGITVQGSDNSLRITKVYTAAGPQSSILLTLNSWQMVTVTFNGTTKNVSYYVNGVSAGSGVFNYSFTGVNNLIGLDVDGGTGVNGKMDEVGYWKKILSSTEITQLYNTGNGKAYSTF